MEARPWWRVAGGQAAWARRLDEAFTVVPSVVWVWFTVMLGAVMLVGTGLAYIAPLAVPVAGLGFLMTCVRQLREARARERGDA